MNLRSIDLHSNVNGCDHIKWSEVLYLPQWLLYSHPHEDQHIADLITGCQALEKIRTLLGNKPIRITCGYRPLKYNEFIDGAIESAHIVGQAIDWQHSEKSADECRDLLKPHLESLGIRMENHKGNWVHIDIRKPGPGGRYFRP